MFAVPYGDPVKDARLVLDGVATWPLPDVTLRRLQATPPGLEVQDVLTPDRPPAEQPFDVHLTIANSGDAGTFRGAFNYTAPMYAPQGIDHHVDAPIVGMSSIEQLEDAVEAVELSLSDSDLEYLEELYEPKPITGHS